MPKKIKISVVGIGLMGQQHIKAINKSKLCVLHSIVEIKKYESKLVKKLMVPVYNSIEYLIKEGLCVSGEEIEETYSISNTHKPFREITLANEDVSD